MNNIQFKSGTDSELIYNGSEICSVISNNNDNNNNKVNTDSDLLVCANCSCPSVETGDQRGTKKQLKYFLWSIHPYAGHPPKGFLYLCLFLFLFLLLYSLFVAMILRMAITTYSAHKTA